VPEKLAGLVVQQPAHFLADALPWSGLRQHQVWFDHFAHHFQVVGSPDALSVGTRAPRRAHDRQQRLFGSGLNLDLGQAAQEQLQLRGVQLLALLAEDAPGQRVEFLTQECVLNPGCLQVLLQRGDLFAQTVNLVLRCSVVHRVAMRDADAREALQLFQNIFSAKRFFTSRFAPRPTRTGFQVHTIEQQLQSLRRQAILAPARPRFAASETFLLQSFSSTITPVPSK
jgi:hypothetical protein